MADLHPVKRALLSVSDKTGLVDFGRALVAAGVELLSTAGTAKALREAGLDVKDVSEVTGFPEMMDGRVKTLHPVVHGGLLALRDNAGHVASMDEHGIGAIDLVVVNLYPFEETVAKGAEYDEVIENIDIGGPAMIRSAAKNHGFVSVIVDVEDYAPFIAEIEANEGQTTYALRQRLAQTAYARTAAYDTAVSTWMAEAVGGTPRRRTFGGTLTQTLRYGENPHQQPHSIPTDRPALVWRQPSNIKAKSCLITTSTTLTQHLSWCLSSIPRTALPLRLSSTPTRVVWHWRNDGRSLCPRF